MADRVNHYEACDKAIKVLNRDLVELFGQMKLANWDKVNIIRTVSDTYRKSANLARRKYYEVSYESYLLALYGIGIDQKTARKMADRVITPEWVDEQLNKTDFVTLYRFFSETERKAYKLAETLEVSSNKSREIDKAMRYWSQQLGQYAINFTDYATIQAFEDAGVEMVEWMSEHDDKVCDECYALNGQLFPVKEIPRKPHWGCRCFWRAVFRDGTPYKVEAKATT